MRDSGYEALVAEYIPTRKNVLVESFLPDNAFSEQADGTYLCDLVAAVQLAEEFPISIEDQEQP